MKKFPSKTVFLERIYYIKFLLLNAINIIMDKYNKTQNKTKTLNKSSIITYKPYLLFRYKNTYYLDLKIQYYRFI